MISPVCLHTLDCVAKICENGGTQNSSTCDCDCPPEYTGEFCESELLRYIRPMVVSAMLMPTPKTSTSMHSIQNMPDLSVCFLITITITTVIIIVIIITITTVIIIIILCAWSINTDCLPKICENGATQDQTTCQCVCPPDRTGELCECESHHTMLRPP